MTVDGVMACQLLKELCISIYQVNTPTWNLLKHEIKAISLHIMLCHLMNRALAQNLNQCYDKVLHNRDLQVNCEQQHSQGESNQTGKETSLITHCVRSSGE